MVVRGKILGMNIKEKQIIDNFLNLTSDFIGSGYKRINIDSIEVKEEPVQILISKEVSIDLTDDSIEKISEEIKICKNCSLGNLRKNAVPGEGVMQPLVMVIGEGPGADEDSQGRPFVGKAGQLLDKMLSSINLSRTTNAFIANVVKCRPPGNRDPLPVESSACAHFLKRQITQLKPKYILAAGRIAAQALMNTKEPMGSMRGKILELQVGEETYPLIVTFHPSALLRSEENKRPAWEDLKFLRSKLEEISGE